MLHAQNVAPLPHRCPVIAAPLFFLETLIAYPEFLHITYTKTTTLIKGPFGTPCGSHESTQQRRGNDEACRGVVAAQHSVHPAETF
jgi:hypothetical protein